MDHDKFMDIALEEASKALVHNDVPIGALIVKSGIIVSSAHNMRYFLKDATMHAEILAIKEACNFFKTQFLDGCDIYVTCEPCLMCSGAIIQARIKNLYFGAYDKKAGCAGSVLNVFTTPFNHIVNVQGGIMEDGCAAIISGFFTSKREEKK